MSAAGSPTLQISPDGDQDRGPGIIWMQTILTAIAMALVLIRLYVRSTIVRMMGLDDLFLVIGLVLAITTLALDGVQVHNGLGRHQYYLSLSPELLEGFILVIKYGYITQLILILSTMFTRLSVCFFLLHIFGSRKPWKIGLYVLTTMILATNIASAALVLVSCRPLPKLWNPMVPGTCMRPKILTSLGDFQGAVAIFCDWVLALLPIAFLWDVQIKPKTKAGICLLMGMGFFTGVSALVRTIMVERFDPSDASWNLVPMISWAILEEDIGIIAACIPAIKPLFSKPLRYPWSKTYNSGGYKAQSDDEHRLTSAEKRSLGSANMRVDLGGTYRQDVEFGGARGQGRKGVGWS